MKNAFRLLMVLILFALPARAADLITATISVTNIPGYLTNTITIDGTTKSWTNSISASPSTLILGTNTMANTATQLLNHLTSYPIGAGRILGQSSASNVTVKALPGQTLTITVAGQWATVAYATNTVTNAMVVRVPITVESATNQTRVASELVSGISLSSTQAFATNSSAISNSLIKGASPLQEVMGPVYMRGRFSVSNGIFVTNGFTVSLTNINPVTSNLVNYGNAIRSEGSGGNSLQVGSNAVAAGLYSVSIGNSAISSNQSSIAVGTSAIATNQFGSAIGNAAIAGDTAVAFGYGAVAQAQFASAVGASSIARASAAIAIGSGADADGVGAIALGVNSGTTTNDNIAVGSGASASSLSGIALGAYASSAYSNSAAIGPPDHLGTGTATTTTNQIVLGTANHSVSIPGTLSAVAISNLATLANSTNILRGDISFPRSAIGTVAAGVNSVNVGTNVYDVLTGAPGAAWSLAGLQGGNRDGKRIILRNATGYEMTVLNESGLEATAGNRITTLIGVDFVAAAASVLHLIYDATDSRWIIISNYP